VSVNYLDSSAWVKRYLEEPGTERVNRMFAGSERFACAGLGYVEVVAALARHQSVRKLEKHGLERLQQDLRDDWGDFIGLPVSDGLLNQAAQLARRHRLRGADAVHLAAALQLRDALAETGEELLLVASDQELLAAATAVGIRTEDPVAIGR
jgi:predicted nucleic acid-binding protein